MLLVVFQTLLKSLNCCLKQNKAFMWLSIILDTYIQKVRKNYMDSRARKNLSSINSELQDVQRIMVQNIDDVLQRGDSLSGLLKKIM